VRVEAEISPDDLDLRRRRISKVDGKIDKFSLEADWRLASPRSVLARPKVES
jgi:hypothetical protein